MPRVVRCPNCSAPLNVDLEQPVVRCQYCGCDVKQTIAIQPPPPRLEPQRPPEPGRPSPPKVFVLPEIPPRPRTSIKFWVWFGIIITMVTSVLPVLCSTGILSTLPSLVRSAAQRVTRPSAEEAARAGLPTSEPPADRSLGDKLAVFATCLTDHAASAQRARERYRSWQPDHAGPTCQERFIGWGVPKLSVNRGAGGCGQHVGELASKPPRLAALEEAARRYVASLYALDDVLAVANRYYDQRDYRDDRCVQGKLLHRRMMDAFAALDEADTALRTGLERELPPLLERRLARAAAENQGGALHAYFKLLLDARRLFLALRFRLQAGGLETDEPLRVLIRLVDEDITLADAADRREPRHTPIGIHAFDTWGKPSALEFLKAAKEVLRRPPVPVRRGAGPPRRHGPVGARRRGQPLPDLVEKYNELLRHLRAPLPAERVPSAIDEATSPPPAEAWLEGPPPPLARKRAAPRPAAKTKPARKPDAARPGETKPDATKSDDLNDLNDAFEPPSYEH